MQESVLHKEMQDFWFLLYSLDNKLQSKENLVLLPRRNHRILST